MDGTDFQAVFVDTPGIHRPKTPLGNRLNDEAKAALADVDVSVLVVDNGAIGPGDRFIAEQCPDDSIVAVNKIDVARREETLAQLERASIELGLSKAEYFPVSAGARQRRRELVAHVVRTRLPNGPRYFPEGTISDVPEAFFVAELVHEQLLRTVRDELPHSIACRVTEWEFPYIRCEILVERPSQVPIVVGKSGAVLKSVGEVVRRSLPPGAYLDLHVKVERDWQRRTELIDRLGY